MVFIKNKCHIKLCNIVQINNNVKLSTTETDIRKSKEWNKSNIEKKIDF